MRNPIRAAYKIFRNAKKIQGLLGDNGVVLLSKISAINDYLFAEY